MAPEVGVALACDALGVCRSTLYRELKLEEEKLEAKLEHHRSLSPDEKATVLETLNGPEFMDKAP